MERAFASGVLVDAGERHLRHRLGGQDHALALRHPGAVVLAVADGASRVGKLPSRAEVGAGLVAELAARSASDAALRGLGPAELRLHVAALLVRHLLPLWVALGDGAGPLLHCTLVLAVSTPTWTSIWRIGDGCWGASGSLAHGYRSPSSSASVACYGTRWSAHERRQVTKLHTTVAHLCRSGDVEVVARGLEPVLEAEGPALTLYVASDGLDEEPQVQALLRCDQWRGDQFTGALARPNGSDDFALAWACERFRGAAGLGLGEAGGA
ncbi:protein phosphatase 2C domain-containing protein [Nannocystis bainbridge]|uniref:Protein phosphatase 2C domain-containing protein n=1 Tax=Nannocystis bainbridge TaxID=2995303 RepID=A0ABT5E1X5_9BACT|nr:protein phosphatase 2C domain-containing protein [Nannocystis bainbridge]MDC0719420.1 protein phosphatase 2C domain-containing protein [Nannocystis bainbridge]